MLSNLKALIYLFLPRFAGGWTSEPLTARPGGGGRRLQRRGRAAAAWSRAAVLWTFLGLSVCARADSVIVRLRNGDQLTGQLLSQDTNQVTIATVWSKSVLIPRKEIENVRMVPILPAAGGTNTPAGTSSTNRPAGARPGPGTTTNAVPLLSVALRPTLPLAQKDGKIHGNIQVGTDVDVASRSQALYYGKVKLSYNKAIFHNYVEYNASYGVTQGVVSDNRMDGTLKSDFDLTKRYYVYNLFSGGYNEIQLIRSQFEEGPGLGYHIYKAPDKIFDAELGGDYQVRGLLTGERDRRFFYRMAELYAWQITTRVSVDEKVELFPQAENPGQYRVRAEGNIHYNLLKHLTLNFSVVDLYDTEPAVGAQHNDLQVHSSLGVIF